MKFKKQDKYLKAMIKIYYHKICICKNKIAKKISPYNNIVLINLIS